MPDRPAKHQVAKPKVAKHVSPQQSYGQGRGGRPWRRKRERILKRDGYLCQPCKRRDTLTLAKEVDHIVPVAEGGTDEDDNLEAICKPCHQCKTQGEAKRGRN